jgi:hypothetical protein
MTILGLLARQPLDLVAVSAAGAFMRRLVFVQMLSC